MVLFLATNNGSAPIAISLAVRGGGKDSDRKCSLRHEIVFSYAQWWRCVLSLQSKMSRTSGCSVVLHTDSERSIDHIIPQTLDPDKYITFQLYPGMRPIQAIHQFNPLTESFKLNPNHMHVSGYNSVYVYCTLYFRQRLSVIRTFYIRQNIHTRSLSA